MQRWRAGITLAVAVAVARPGGVAASERMLRVDPAQSSASFSVRHFGIFRVTGTIPLRAGTLSVDESTGIPTAAAADLTVAGIDTGINARDRTLRGPNWFDAGSFAGLTFTSSAVTSLGGGRFRMVGILTIRGTSKPVVLRSRLMTPPGTMPAVYDATASVNRRDFGLDAGEPVVGDSVAIALHVVASPP